MNCLVDNCKETPTALTLIGFVCDVHRGMLPAELNGVKLKKLCLRCNQEDCIHIKEGIVGDKLTVDGKPETLGINVAEEIKAGERFG